MPDICYFVRSIGRENNKSMAVVVKMAGTSPELYSCIAPLVMNPEIIKYNHNYPFKTSESFVWFVAFSDEDNHVLGFFLWKYGKNLP